ncbi:MAG TPA: carbohydrate porin [Myxococcota bacterium]|nr:carbohydrate porin [Myxococcota bacterium]
MLPILLLSAVLAAEPDELIEEQGFYAGSYGRAQATFDLTGGRGDPVNVASHGPRTELGPYMELDLGWRFKTKQGARFNVLVTPALSGDVFHYTGQFNAQLAVRNLYAEARDFLPGAPIAVWAGSRMYRGDDIYLLDFWPMDNLNTLGGGIDVHPGNTEVAWQIGTNRLLGDDFQLQLRKVQVPDQVDGEDVLFLDRQRVISSLRVMQFFPIGALTLRLKLYGELHALPPGSRVVDDAFTEPIYEDLPKDWGSNIGVQLSLWGWAKQSFVHLWFRRATGLAAYGELAIPRDGLATDLRAAPAESYMVAATGNHETPFVGVMGAFYAQRFHDADGQRSDFDDRWELAGIARANFYPARLVAIGLELSHQHVRPDGVNPWTGHLDRPDITKLAILPGIQLGKGGYSRPRVQVTYQASFLDQAAVDFFSPDDQRISGRVQHFIGLGAEWWVNAQRITTPVGPQR